MCVLTQSVSVCGTQGSCLGGKLYHSQTEVRERQRTVLDSRSFRGRVSGEWKDEGPARTEIKLKLVSTHPSDNSNDITHLIMIKQSGIINQPNSVRRNLLAPIYYL